MAEAGVVGIARIVMHNKEHMVALMPAGPALMLETLRWATEIRAPEGLNLPSPAKGAAKPKESELKLARQLIGQLTAPWKPEQFHDRFAEQMRKLVAAKAAAGKSFEVTALEHVEEGEGGEPSNVVDLAALLRNSLGARRGAASSRPSKAARPGAHPAADESGVRTSRPASRKAPATKTPPHRRPAAHAATRTAPARKRA
jgi:DNA end-binding protein Ku